MTVTIRHGLQRSLLWLRACLIIRVRIKRKWVEIVLAVGDGTACSFEQISAVAHLVGYHGFPSCKFYCCDTENELK